jgi:hypothetical protein
MAQAMCRRDKSVNKDAGVEVLAKHDRRLAAVVAFAPMEEAGSGRIVAVR